MRSSYRALDPPTKKKSDREREREEGGKEGERQRGRNEKGERNTGRVPDKCGICNGPGNEVCAAVNLQILISC